MVVTYDSFSQYTFSNSDKYFLLLLFHIQKVGRQTAKLMFLHLKKHELNTADFWVVFEQLLIANSYFEKKLQSIKKSKIEQLYSSTIRVLKKDTIRVVAFWEDDYPKLLLQTDDFPLLLFVKGKSSLLQKQAVGVVGTRKVTSYGELVTRKLVSELVAYDYVIISGCMYGVDMIAHKEALESQGATVGVLGYGFEYIPTSNIVLLQNQILAKGGCLVSEYLPHVAPNKGTFPERNRIVAGMSLGVLVTEAAVKSGTHITAECALDAGREVFAVPGSIFNPFSAGTMYLVNQGAKLVSSAQDVIEEFTKVTTIPGCAHKQQGNPNLEQDTRSLKEKPYDSRQNAPQNSALQNLEAVFQAHKLDSVSQSIVKQLLYLPQTVEALLQKTQLSITVLLSVLSVLELKNIIKNEGGIWHCVVSYSSHSK